MISTPIPFVLSASKDSEGVFSTLLRFSGWDAELFSEAY